MNVSFGESKLQYDFYVKHLLSVMARLEPSTTDGGHENDTPLSSTETRRYLAAHLYLRAREFL